MIIYVTAISGFLIVSLLTISAVHHYKKRKILKKELSVDSDVKEKIAKKIGVEEALVPGVALFDVLYNTAKMSPDTLAGIEHLHNAQNFENMGDLVNYMKENIIHSEEGSKAWRSMVHKYKGYTGEEMAFDNLRESGHDVAVPESGTEEGLDAVVDGESINIKVTDNPAYIQEHIDKYPDIPVYTNMEMKEAFADNPNVIVDPDLSAQEAFHDTADTFDGISDLGDFLDNIPLITLTISTIKNAKGVMKKDKNIKTAAEHIICDTVGVGVGGWAGGEIGLGIGLSLAPVTGGLSVPIATLFGSIVGIFTGKSITNWFKKRHLRAAIKEMKQAAKKLRSSFLGKFNLIINKAIEYYDKQIKRFKYNYKQKEGFLKRVFFPSFMSKFYQMAIRKSGKEKRETKKFYNNLKIRIENISDYKDYIQFDEKVSGGLLIHAQGKSILNGVEGVLKNYDELDTAIKEVHMEKRKLKN